MHFLHIVGARPNFMKLAPVYGALSQAPSISQTIVHTGQHYDAALSDIFFQQLNIPMPDVHLKIGSGSHSYQTAEIMKGVERVLEEKLPDRVVVYGDVNSTVAAALVSAKMGIPAVHVEAGLRSFDRSMPEEINRLVTDQLSDFLFTPSVDGNVNLEREGIAKSKIFLVGNVMIDTLVRMRSQIEERARTIPGEFILVTLHRPSNVDDIPWLCSMLEMLARFSQKIDVRFPVHPRTRERLKNLSADFSRFGKLDLMQPVPYLDFLALQSKAKLVITDSGGIQEETTFLGVPCLTVRENTERPITVTCGTNVLAGRDLKVVGQETEKVLSGNAKKGTIPPLWDGQASTRIADILTNSQKV